MLSETYFSISVLCLMLVGCFGTEVNDPLLHRVRRLIDGTVLPEGQPWMSVLAYKNDPQLEQRPYLIVCGATLIDDRNVLAAAHCLDEDVTPVREGATLYVVLGLKDNSFGEVDNVQEFPIDGVEAEAVSHPDYVAALVFQNDVALVRLSSPAHLCADVEPLPLPPADLDLDKVRRCDFYGWGVTDEPVTDAVFTQFLRTAPLRKQRLDRCQRFYLGTLSDDQHVCAAGDAFPCFGDSGSPLICRRRKDDFLVGINSFRRFGACDLGSPQVYTNIVAFLDWINANKL